jgi:hypothetical protein
LGKLLNFSQAWLFSLCNKNNITHFIGLQRRVTELLYLQCFACCLISKKSSVKCYLVFLVASWLEDAVGTLR